LTIEVSGTPNPHAVKLTLNCLITTRGETYREMSTTTAPWAKALLEIPGVVAVYGINNFISINKQPEAAWEAIVPSAQAALKRVFQVA